MITPYFSKLCHGHTCLLNAPSNLIFTATRIIENFELTHNGLLTLFLDDYRALYLRS
ncbi:unnamed protein product [Callosobruchus maculatus]|uniref:Uncharacterized protein n=1 Tax=Callosobruchus maculatus TaxID=64391 RepID=A0A653BZN5_CALMS|nr:unnamed protein product [Callosobruchus maculatus]